MIKLILYILLFSIGGYYASGYIPDSAKEKFISAVGLKGKSFNVLNPSAKRAEILQKLENNVSKLEQFQLGGDLAQQNEKDAVIEESKALLEEMKELNPKTGILPGVVGKIFGIGSGSQQSTTTNQVIPEFKDQICK
jgi:hypothetical protein